MDFKASVNLYTKPGNLKLSRSTVKRAISDLEKAEFIMKVRRYRENGGCTSNLYVLSV